MSARCVSSYFKPGFSVEVTFDEEGFRGSWFSGTIIRCLALDRFIVEFHNLVTDKQTSNPLREVMHLRQLRPQPPPGNHQQFKSGDKVDAFHNNGWWECHITEDLGTGKFGVYLKESNENMVFPKEQLRIHHDWINLNWVPLQISESTNHIHKTSKKEKERKRKLEVTRIERERSSRRNKINNRDIDRLSDLPDCVLLHIMKFMDTKHAVQTCLLSKRWKLLCKRLTNLTFHIRSGIFRKFASWILSNRDHSCSLLNLRMLTWIEPQVLNRVIEYAVCHNLQNLMIRISTNYYPSFEALPLIFCSRSLTSLTLSLGYKSSMILLPKSIQLPAIKTMDLAHVSFTATHYDCAVPFSNCPVLDTLILENCSLHNDAKVLHISNSTLSRLRIHIYLGKAYQLVLSTPNLGSFAMKGFRGHQLSSTCSLSHVCDVHFDMNPVARSDIIRWLQLFTHVKKLTITPVTLENILLDLSNPSSICCQPPCFVRLESLNVKLPPQKNPVISSKDVKSVAKYLLQNTRVISNLSGERIVNGPR
ncbi:hypothetical protein VNO77_34972 [Canavalia gladiata]|uniref:F-box domain-containing protein n=1 Tax=Canavalia gladiata TaxID=3824 RepID=A0AAN9PZH5_CANGL